jgi:hypothetical protein
MIIMHLELDDVVILVAEDELYNTLETISTEHGVE